MNFEENRLLHLQTRSYQLLTVKPPKGQLHPKMECVCGDRIRITRMYQCLYCGVWFCTACAEKHFGKNREQRWAELRKELEDEDPT